LHEVSRPVMYTQRAERTKKQWVPNNIIHKFRVVLKLTLILLMWRTG